MQPSLIPSGISELSVELLPDSYKSNEILPNALFVGLLTDGCAKADESINGTNASHFNIALHVKERDKRVEGFLGRTREIVLGFGICHVARHLCFPLFVMQIRPKRSECGIPSS